MIFYVTELLGFSAGITYYTTCHKYIQRRAGQGRRDHKLIYDRINHTFY